jgi:3-methylcrotonyl-CoA carboxylase alpha subunit
MLDVSLRGVAVEARVYAEDPAADYLPSVGRIRHLRWPEGLGLRVDAGVDAGDEVSPYYDPMLGKVIAWGETRLQAIAHLHRAVSELEIVGVATNRVQLVSVLADATFREGGVGTGFFLARGDSLRLKDPAPSDLERSIAALWLSRPRDGAELWDECEGWRLNAAARRTMVFGNESVHLQSQGAGRCTIDCTGRQHSIRLLRAGEDELRIEFDGRIECARVVDIAGDLHIFVNGHQIVLRETATEDSLEIADVSAEGSLVSPLPGVVTAIHASVGQKVERGAVLVTMEAMKMEYSLRAPHDGVVAQLRYEVGQRVAEGATVVELEAVPK